MEYGWAIAYGTAAPLRKPTCQHQVYHRGAAKNHLMTIQHLVNSSTVLPLPQPIERSTTSATIRPGAQAILKWIFYQWSTIIPVKTFSPASNCNIHPIELHIYHSTSKGAVHMANPVNNKNLFQLSIRVIFRNLRGVSSISYSGTTFYANVPKDRFRSCHNPDSPFYSVLYENGHIHKKCKQFRILRIEITHNYFLKLNTLP